MRALPTFAYGILNLSVLRTILSRIQRVILFIRIHDRKHYAVGINLSAMTGTECAAMAVRYGTDDIRVVSWLASWLNHWFKSQQIVCKSGRNRNSAIEFPNAVVNQFKPAILRKQCHRKLGNIRTNSQVSTKL